MKKRAARSLAFIRKVKLFYIVLAIVILVMIIIRLALPGMVQNYVNQKLNQLPGYTGHVDDVDIHLYRGAYVIKGLLLKKTTDPAAYPFLKISRADLSIEWAALFHRRLVGKITLDQPVVNILSTESIQKEPSKESWTKTVKALMPMTINRLVVNDGRFDYRELT